MKLDQLARFEGMKAVQEQYTAAKLTDTEFAKSISSEGRVYSTAMIREWRRVLGMPVWAQETEQVSQLKDAIRALLALSVAGFEHGDDSTLEIINRAEELIK